MTDWIKILSQVPDVAAVIAVVWMFIKHTASEGKANREYMAAQNSVLVAFYKDMHHDHITQSEAVTRTMAQLVGITEKNISATARNTFVLESLADSIKVGMRHVSVGAAA